MDKTFSYNHPEHKSLTVDGESKFSNLFFQKTSQSRRELPVNFDVDWTSDSAGELEDLDHYNKYYLFLCPHHGTHLILLFLFQIQNKSKSIFFYTFISSLTKWRLNYFLFCNFKFMHITGPSPSFQTYSRLHMLSEWPAPLSIRDDKTFVQAYWCWWGCWQWESSTRIPTQWK